MEPYMQTKDLYFIFLKYAVFTIKKRKTCWFVGLQALYFFKNALLAFIFYLLLLQVARTLMITSIPREISDPDLITKHLQWVKSSDLLSTELQLLLDLHISAYLILNVSTTEGIQFHVFKSQCLFYLQTVKPTLAAPSLISGSALTYKN